MNIWTSLDTEEHKMAARLRAQTVALSKLNGIEYEYYFKCVSTGIGTVVLFVCEKLEIEEDITNYKNW